MALLPMDNDLNIIAGLSDEPNDVDGLSAQELKTRFDRAGLLIQEYINTILLPAISGLDRETREALKQYVDATAANFTLGLLSPGSVTNEMLATPIHKTVIYFTTADWSETDNGVTLTLKSDTHKVTAPLVSSVAHNIDGTYHNNTVAALSTCIRRDAANNMILESDTAFDGRLVLIW